MGQRLNIEITDNGKILANSYYHWGGYTSSAVERTIQIVNQMPFTKHMNDKRVIAIALLQATGAGFNQEEQEKVVQLYGHKFNDATDRNSGLLSVSEEGIEETRKWEEGRVTIDITTNRIDFEVFYTMSDEEYQSDYELDATDLPEIDFELHDLRFEQLMQLETFSKEHSAFRVKGEDDLVYGFIE